MRLRRLPPSGVGGADRRAGRMASIRGIPTGNVSYLEFLAPGILAQSALFVAIFYGISTIWERDLGILAKYLASPSPRGALVLGKGLGAGVRALSQAVVVFVLALLLHVPLRASVLGLIAIVAIVMLGAAIFCTFSLIIACLVKTRERFMGIGQVLTMPLFFASNAIYPMSIMPSWLRAIAVANPLTYQVDALRALMLRASPSAFGLSTDFAVLGGVLVMLVWIASRLYPTILY